MTRVLVVEDWADVLCLLQMELERLGYKVDAVADGYAGLIAAKRARPDVIVSDIGMPEMDGFEFIKRIRAMPGFSLVPAIALTGAGMEKDVHHALACGFTAHLVKPVETADLANRIEQLTARRLQRKAS